MSPDKSLQNLFNEALERRDAAERARFLDEACGADTALRQRVERLLRAREEAGAFMAQPSRRSAGFESRQTGSVVTPLTERPGDRIGHYKLLQQIGEGGCGVVYMAEQEEPVRRRVALKVIKLGMDTKQVIARFEAERQALAMMDHPNIARVLDAGATDTGRPYFVMELVRGIKVTEFCDQKKLSTRERLELSISICQAVQHAHQKGIIHRDIKPSNILVTTVDGTPVPKVIDFGVAKATSNQPLTDKTLFTAFAQFIGTPAYMSPEQAEMSGVDVDTRTDIYSLGVVLYELLTGRTPFDTEALLGAGIDEIRRTIREQDPPKPSTRLHALTPADLTTTAQARHLDGHKLMQTVKGDLDWIVMKCLEKERGRRYETVSGLAADIRRYLNTEPVVARPPSKLYEFQKTVRRHKLGFAATAAIIIVLAAGVVMSTWEAVRATRAEREQTRLRSEAVDARNNEAELRVKAEANEQRAETEAARSEQVARFMKEMLKGVGPSVALGRDTIMLREILDKTSDRVGKELTNQPEVEIEMRLTLADTYDELGLYQQEEQMARESLRLARSIRGSENELVARSLESIGCALCRLGKLEEAEDTLREGLAMEKKLVGVNSLGVARFLSLLAVVMEKRGNLAEAETLDRQALALRKRLLGKEHPAVAASLNNLARLLEDRGELAEAEIRFRESLALYRKLLGNGHPNVAISLNNLGDVLREQGKLAEAETLDREALAMKKRLLGNEHPTVVNSLSMLGLVLRDQGKLAEAETQFREALAMQSKLLGNEHPNVVWSLNNLADVQARQGKWKEAADHFASLVQREPTDHSYYHSLAALLAADGDMENYRSCCKEIVARFGNTTDPFVGDRMAKDCSILPSSGADVEVVGKMADAAIAAGSTNLFLAYFQCTKGMAEYRLGHFADALIWLDKSTDILNTPGNYYRVDTLYVEAYAVSAMAHFQLKQADEARTALGKAKESAETRLPKLESGDLGPNWLDWIIAHKLLEEATRLIEDGK